MPVLRLCHMYWFCLLTYINMKFTNDEDGHFYYVFFFHEPCVWRWLTSWRRSLLSHREIMKDTMYIKKLLLHNALFDTCITMKLCNRYHGTHFKSSMNADRTYHILVQCIIRSLKRNSEVYFIFTHFKSCMNVNWTLQ